MELENNTTDCVDTEGVAIYADESTVTIDKCSFVGNAVMSGKNKYACSVIYASDCEITVTNSNFENNASKPTSEYDYAYLFKLEDSSMTMEGGKLTGNNSTLLFYTDESEATIKGVSITGNASAVIGVYNDTKKVNMSQCTLENNTPADDATQNDSGNSVGLWIGVALAVLVVAIIVVVILIKRKKA